MTFSTVDRLSAEQQIQRLEANSDKGILASDIEEMRTLLKREYTRDAMTTLEYMELSKRVKKLMALLGKQQH